MSHKLVKSPDKPLSEFTADDFRVFRSPSVEDKLNEIRQALALATLLNTALERVEDFDFGHENHLQQDAASALNQVCHPAWRAAAALSEALPGYISNLIPVEADDPPGGAQMRDRPRGVFEGAGLSAQSEGEPRLDALVESLLPGQRRALFDLLEHLLGEPRKSLSGAEA